MKRASRWSSGLAVTRGILAQVAEASMGDAEGDRSFEWGGVFTDAVP